MWGNSTWGQMIWGGRFAVPALGPASFLVLGCVLGIIAVLYLRSARKVGLLMTLLVLLVPLTALASVPFIFANGTIADANQINQNFAAVIPLVGKSSASSSISGTGATFVFPPSAAFVAPRNLRCIVTFQPFAVSGGGQTIVWSPAIKVGTTSSTMSPDGIPFTPTLIELRSTSAFDHNYSGTYTEVIQVSSGSSIAFGAQFFLFGASSGVYQPTINTVYECSVTP